jgi:prepilin-type N-terminal cleavage/methylation domain-containing protein
MFNKKVKSAFTLIELAIVLVIIGVLVVGVLAGQELIKQAKITNTLMHLRSNGVAVDTFKVKYNAIPGDFNRAVQFGIHHPADDTTPNLAGAGNGNGSGILTRDRFFGSEVANFWVMLSNVGLVKGSFSQISGCYHPQCNNTADLAFPKTQVGGATAYTSSYSGGLVTLLGADRTLETLIGHVGDEGTFGTGNLAPDEAYAIDSKLDDGKPNTGAVQSYWGYGGIPYGPGSEPARYVFFYNDEPDDQSCENANGEYNVSLKNKLCNLIIAHNDDGGSLNLLDNGHSDCCLQSPEN